MIMNVFISILTISTIYALTFNKFNAPSTNSFVECSAEECLTTNWPWMDASLPLNTRVNLLVSEMTQEEKVSQLLSTHLYKEDTSSFLKKYGSIGFGVLLPCPRVRKGSISSASQCMQWRNYIQTHFSTKSRLHIPISFREELLHSAGIPGSTVYPMPANLGATWNQSLVTAVYAMVAREARAAGVDYGFGPVLQVATNALWGRNQEAFGGDPILVSVLSKAATRGLQGEETVNGRFNSSVGILCQAKHFFAYGHMGHDSLPVDLSETTLREVYLRPWRDWVREANGQAVMVAHTPLNGLPLAAHHHYLTSVLRHEIAGSSRPLTIASDGADVSHLYSTWRVARTLGEAGALAMNAGVDQELMTDWTQFAFEAAANRDLLATSHLDRAVKNVLRLKFLAGLFDTPGPSMPDPKTVAVKFQLPDARQLSYDAAVQSAVLLVNRKQDVEDIKGGEIQGGLPLHIDGFRSVLLLGPNAGCKQNRDRVGPDDRHVCSARGAAMGGYYAPTASEDIITLEDAVRAHFSPSSKHNTVSGVRVAYHPGASVCSDFHQMNSTLLEDALAAVENKDVHHDLIILGLGDNSDTDSRECQQCGEGRDRTSLDLSGGQFPLLSAVLDSVMLIKRFTGRVIPVVVVLLHGRPVTFNGAVNSISSRIDGHDRDNSASNAILRHPALTALIAAWRPGPFGGTALWNLIRGLEQFSGKLTQPWPRNAGQVQSASCPWFQLPLREGGVGDMYAFQEPQAPLFPFSAGIIPQTSFQFSRLRVHHVQLQQRRRQQHGEMNSVLNVSVVVKNTGTAGGSALVALYYSPPVVPHVLRYARRLVTFMRVYLEPQGFARVPLQVLVERDFSRYDAQLRDYVVDSGVYGLHVGDCCVTGVLPLTDAECRDEQQVTAFVTI